jgi:ferredoxin like protein
METLSVSDRLAKNRYQTDERGSHIRVDQEAARRAGSAQMLVRVCPARVFRQESDGTISVSYAGCLECGTCVAVAPPGSLEWRYPSGGHGVQHREG